jgi:predicted DCC family thiol-disulfide oxidoreductase YuxK
MPSTQPPPTSEATIQPASESSAARPRARQPAWFSWLAERYGSLDPRWLGIFRVLFGLILISELVARWRYARLLFSNDGLLPNHYSLFAPMGQDLFSVYHVFSTVGEVHVAFALTLLVFVLFTIGYRTRLFHVLSAILITSLHSRNLFMENGGSVVTHSLAVWTLFLPLGRCFSIDALRRSFAARTEQTSAELNDRDPSTNPGACTLLRDAPPFRSVIVLGLLLQWSVIYFFNAVHKSGVGWRDGSAIHYFLYQDRIVTAFGVWAREHVPEQVLWLLTRATLHVEGVLAFILLVPLAHKQLRRVAFVLALGLHGSIAALSRLGPFSYVMMCFFVMLFGQTEFDWLSRWFGRRERAVTVIYDADCGICTWMCRLLKRLDPWARLTFVGNDEAERFPQGVTEAITQESVVAVDARGRIFTEERAVRRIAGALPLGILLVAWLYVPGLQQLGGALYRYVARERLRISSFFGLGVCGVTAIRPKAATPKAQSRLAQELAGSRVLLRETLALLLMVVLGTEVLKANPYVSRRTQIKRPEWMTRFIGYTRMLEGWGMFAPEPPYDDGRLVVDGRTVDGRKFDPFTGEDPVFDPESPRGWGHDQLWCDYSNHIRWPHNQGRRQFLKNYLMHQHRYSGRPRDELVAFDVWWIQDKSPKPGQKRGKPLAPQRLVSHGTVEDSGAKPWLERYGKADRS